MIANRLQPIFSNSSIAFCPLSERLLQRFSLIFYFPRAVQYLSLKEMSKRKGLGCLCEIDLGLLKIGDRIQRV
jgi:hypothetical protein